MSILLSAEELRDLIEGPDPVHVLDVRWTLAEPDGRPAYRRGHVPGAVYVDLDTELAAHGAPQDGRHPLPSAEALQEAARGWGLREGERVVVYDDARLLSAARAWWLLTHAGVREVALLDGGLAAWRRAGLPLATGDEPAPPRGDATLAYGHLEVIGIDEAAAYAEHGVLLDARAAERYRGEVEPIDPRAGHIPGAVSAPTTETLDDDGRFRDPDDLREHFARLGVRDDAPVATYCGSGVTAAHAAVALTLAGHRPALYPGSWSQWSNHPDRPVATSAVPQGVGR